MIKGEKLMKEFFTDEEIIDEVMEKEKRIEEAAKQAKIEQNIKSSVLALRGVMGPDVIAQDLNISIEKVEKIINEN